MTAPPVTTGPRLGPGRFVTVVFLAILASAGVLQTALELSRGQGVQALRLVQQTPTAVNLRAFERNLEDTSWLISRLRPWYLGVRFRFLRDPGPKAITGRADWLFYRPGVEYLTQRTPAADRQALGAEPAAAIVRFRDDLSARGIHLVVVPIPNKESIHPAYLARRAHWVRTIMSDHTREVLAQLAAARVDVVDLFQLFGSVSREHSPLYLRQDTHWSPAGVQLAAETVAAHLMRPGWLQPGATPYETREVHLTRLGDLLRMAQSPALERAAQPESLACTQVVAPADAQPYRDDPQSTVLVLGDSFLRIYQTDEPGAAGFIAHLARALRRPVHSLVSDGGAATLVRQELHRRPALLARTRIVVWEFVERDLRFAEEGWQTVPLPPPPATPGLGRQQWYHDPGQNPDLEDRRSPASPRSI